MHPKHTQIRIVLVMGLLAALVSHINFNVPGISDLTTDPREIVAFGALFIITNWRAAFIVGLLAGLGGPYTETLWITILAHIIAVPMGYLIYRQIRNRFTNQVIISMLWSALVLFLYVVVFACTFIFAQYFRGVLTADMLLDVYLHVVKGLFVESLITMGITLLLLQIKLAREERHLDEQLISLIMSSNEFGIWDWRIQQDEFKVNQSLVKMLGTNEHDFGSTMPEFKKLVL